MLRNLNVVNGFQFIWGYPSASAVGLVCSFYSTLRVWSNEDASCIAPI